MLPDVVRLRHMLETAQLTLQIIEGVDRASFDKQIALQWSTIRGIEIIGEAASTLSEEFQRQHPSLPWNLMKRMRNQLIHAYFNVDLNIVWDTLQHDLPVLIPELKCILQEEESKKSIKHQE